MKTLQTVSVIIPTYNRRRQLLRLLDSINKSNYPLKNLQIIVVDDKSDYDVETVTRQYPRVILLKNSKKQFVSEIRNQGLKYAKGKYLFFIDDDNVVHKKCIKYLVSYLERDQDTAIVGPVIYYYNKPDTILCAGVKRNRITSITTYVGRNKPREYITTNSSCDDFPNSFMVRSDIAKQVGGFDSIRFPIHYEESDFAARIRTLKYNIMNIAKAQVWHDVRTVNSIFEDQSVTRVYYTFRNRVMFHKIHTSFLEYLVFLLAFSPLINIYYTFQLFFSKSRTKLGHLKSIYYGTLRGIID